MVAVVGKKAEKAFNLSEFRRRSPATVANLAALPNRELWLERIWELDERWRKSFETGEFEKKLEVLSNERNGALDAEADFDVIYAGGGLGLIHAAVMAAKYNRRVLIFDAHAVGRTHRDWNISDEELIEFERSGLFSKDELRPAVVNRYRTGFVKFHDANSRLKTPPLFMNDVLNVALEADALLQLAVAKVKNSNTDSVLINNLKFLRARTTPEKVFVETEDARSGRRRTFSARLFVDATGTNSPVSRQINEGRSITHVCPTVGTVARGFTRGASADEVDFTVGEILVSNEDASDHRQLIWEGFAGSPRRDDYTTYLFFYDSINSKADKSLLALFEAYFEKLPSYKRPTAAWHVVKPVFGYIPSFHHHGWRNQKRTAANRVLLVGDAAGLSSPLTFCGFGSHVRNLRQLTEMTETALEADALDEKSLAEINAYEPRVAQMSSLAEFMRPVAKSRASVVNETMNAVMAALNQLDEKVRQDLFKDRITFAGFRSLLKKTAVLHPAVFRRMIEHLGVKGSFWWLANIAEAALNERSLSNQKSFSSDKKS
jgi:lycopene cyclase CruA